MSINLDSYRSWGLILFLLGIASPPLALGFVGVFGRMGEPAHNNPWVIVPLVVGFMLIPAPSFGLGAVLSLLGIRRGEPRYGSRLSLALNACGLLAVLILYVIST